MGGHRLLLGLGLILGRGRRVGDLAFRQDAFIFPLGLGGGLRLPAFAALALLGGLLDLLRRELILGRRLAFGLRLGLARLGDLLHVLRLGRGLGVGRFVRFRFVDLQRVVFDLARGFGVVGARDAPLHDLLLGLLLDVVDVDHVVHDRLVDDRRVADGTRALEVPTAAIAVVT
ncbi:hypothetical protein [Methyloceanibacter marginalis]|nr:hypothetical protein [Methyloceanibacter marginalis]